MLNGKAVGRATAQDYYRTKTDLWPHVTGALDRLRREYDLVIVEGAGSPAEPNLRHSDIANMRVALYARAAVLLVGDIDRGGVFGSLLGTLELLEPAERELVRGILINRFRGDPAVLAPLPQMIADRTGVPIAGVIPMIPDLRIQDEDAAVLDSASAAGRAQNGAMRAAVIRFPRVSNFDDFAPLERCGLRVEFVTTPENLAGAHYGDFAGNEEHHRRPSMDEVSRARPGSQGRPPTTAQRCSESVAVFRCWGRALKTHTASTSLLGALKTGWA